ncbi:MAG: hypothetical protein GY765_29165, partial [bacterium]|nr:hypothetical protein [bacterium]
MASNKMKLEPTKDIELITFKLFGETFGIAAGCVGEMLETAEPTPVPNAPAYLLGLINLEGIIIPVLDLSKRLGRNFSKPGDKSRILVIDRPGTTPGGGDPSGERTGILVDEVSEVLRINTSRISPPPRETTGFDKVFLEGVVKPGDLSHHIFILNPTQVPDIRITRERKLTANTIIDAGPGKTGSGKREAKKQETIARGHQPKKGKAVHPKKEPVPETLTVIFSIAGEEFGLGMEQTGEIFSPGEITPVPNAPDYILGVAHLGGRILPVVNSRARFGLTSKKDGL